MPRNVRNFWIELEVDGRKQRIATGPVSKGGGFSLTVKMRDQGEIITALSVEGVACSDNTLILRAAQHPDYARALPSIDLIAKTQR